MINLYWNVGAYINKQLASAGWGKKTVDELADFIQKNHPDLKGFTRRGLYRMKQFYQTVTAVRTQLSQHEKKMSAAGTQLEISDIRNSVLAKLSWTHHRIIYQANERFHPRIG